MSVQFAGQCPWAVSGKVWQKIRAVVALRAADTLGGSQAVSMALDVRQHGSKTPCRWLWWNGIYNFSTISVCQSYQRDNLPEFYTNTKAPETYRFRGFLCVLNKMHRQVILLRSVPAAKVSCASYLLV